MFYTKQYITAAQVEVSFNADYERAYVWMSDPLNGRGAMLGGIYTGTWNYAKQPYATTLAFKDHDSGPYADTLAGAIHAIIGEYNATII